MIKIVTDSTSDLPPEVASELGITVVPLYIYFGDEVYRDGVDINIDQLFYKMKHNRCISPRTSTPSPGDFAHVYNRLAAETDGILSIHLSPKYSGTYNAARMGRNYVQGGCKVGVIDSNSVSMGLGLTVIAAARAARAGANFEQVTATVHRAIQHTHLLGMVTDIEYVLGGKRLSLPGMQTFLARAGKVLKAKLLGEIYEAGKIRGIGIFRSEAKAFDRLERLLAEFPCIGEMFILHAATSDWAYQFAGRITQIFPKERLHMARLGCVTAMHAGPKAMAVAFIEREEIDN